MTTNNKHSSGKHTKTLPHKHTKTHTHTHKQTDTHTNTPTYKTNKIQHGQPHKYTGNDMTCT